MTAAAAADLTVSCKGGLAGAPDPLRVWVYDPWCRTPWYTAALTKALAHCGHDARLVCPSYRLEPTYFRDEDLIPRPGVLDLASRFGNGSARVHRVARLSEYLVNKAFLKMAVMLDAPHIIHQQQCVLLEHGWEVELGFLESCRKRGVRVVHTVHNLLPHQKKGFHAPIYADLYQLADALICHDDQAASALNKQFRIPRDRIHVIPHGPLFGNMPSLSIEECRQRLALPSHRPVFLALGVLAQYKGLDVLLDAWNDLLPFSGPSPEPLLVIAGSGSATEIRALVTHAAKLGLTPQTLRLDLRYLASGELPLYQKAADVLLYPYRDITTSGALLTGLNYSKPVVASDLPAFRGYLLPDTNALLVPPGDRRGLTMALQTILQPACYERLKHGSRENRSQLVQWDEIGIRVAKVYCSLLP
jgi:glycosyltransferase involved in cell wall biosynthesis